MAESVIQEVTIETIDQAVKDWFDKTVDAHVEFPNGDRRKVPVIFSSGERAVTSRQRKGMRDNNGVLILPLISVRRSGISPQPTMQALGTEVDHMTVSKLISGKSNDLQNLYTKRDPTFRSPNPPSVYEVTTIPFPSSTIFSYELVVQTQYITQMNKIVQKLFHELELQKTFVAPFENQHRHPPDGHGPHRPPNELMDRGYVVGFFDNDVTDSGNFEEFTDQERIIKFNTSFTVPATLQLDPEGERPSVQKEYTAFGLKFSDEKFHFVDDPLELELIFGRGKVREK